VKIADLKTPCALVDLDRFEANAARMAEKARRLGVRLRPHVKTHKCVEAARIQTRDHFGGITVSTLAEARGFADRGFNDITYAVPVDSGRLDECADLHHRLDRFNLLLDHPNTLADVERFAASSFTQFSVFLKVDSGLHRAGVDPDSDEAMRLASALHDSPLVDFRGVLTHAGHSYRCRTVEEVRPVAEAERDVAVGFADRLREAGMTVPEISVGSTPTATAAQDLTGVTEMRPGNYAFHDAVQVAIGTCDLADVALSVLARVVGVYPHRNEFVINGGALALSKDPGPTHVDPDSGFGVVVSVEDQRPIPGLRLVSLTQEHGVVRSESPLDGSLRPGSLFRILPNHSCLTAACFDRYQVVRGHEVVKEWKPVRGW
jgi:D-serine deaminase-like pyridoxal phosphate-dependent protein